MLVYIAQIMSQSIYLIWDELLERVHKLDRCLTLYWAQNIFTGNPFSWNDDNPIIYIFLSQISIFSPILYLIVATCLCLYFIFFVLKCIAQKNYEFILSSYIGVYYSLTLRHIMLFEMDVMGQSHTLFTFSSP